MYMSNLGRAHIFVWSLCRTFLHIFQFAIANSVIIVLVNVVNSVLVVKNVVQAGAGRVDLKQFVAWL